MSNTPSLPKSTLSKHLRINKLTIKSAQIKHGSYLPIQTFDFWLGLINELKPGKAIPQCDIRCTRNPHQWSNIYFQLLYHNISSKTAHQQNRLIKDNQNYWTRSSNIKPNLRDRPWPTLPLIWPVLDMSERGQGNPKLDLHMLIFMFQEWWTKAESWIKGNSTWMLEERKRKGGGGGGITIQRRLYPQSLPCSSVCFWRLY